MYDKEEDILSLSRGRPIKASIDIGDFIIDVDHGGFISGIEVLSASKNLGLSKKTFESLTKASMRVTYKPDYVYVTIILEIGDREKDISIPLTVDLGHESVKTERARFAVA